MHLLSRTTFRNVQNVSKFGNRFGKRFGHSGTPEELDATAEKWKKIFLGICVPSILICSVHCYITEKEHLSHPRPEFKKYDYMYIRKKPFPWGDGNVSLNEMFINAIRFFINYIFLYLSK